VNGGPGNSASWLEILLAITFVILVFGALAFSFAVPIVGFFSTHKERWADYSCNDKLRVIFRTSLAIATIVSLLVLSTGPIS
jgi:Sec-independent protein secretion pathway component TatC